MGARTAIEWTDATWNPLIGCSRVSEGCRHCYAERLVHRGLSPQHRGLTKLVNGTPHWTGEVRLVESALTLPLRWQDPRRIFVNSLSDLFHESVADETIDRIFAVMALARRHTFQVLTKRPERMRRYLSALKWERLIECCNQAADGGPHRPESYSLSSINGRTTKARFVAGEKDAFRPLSKLPLPNVWLGVSAEDQATADERIPELLQTPAAVRFVSAEPLLGPIDFETETEIGPLSYLKRHEIETGHPTERVDWVIAGGESGPGARPCDLAWIESVRDQAKAAGVAVFIKQLGAVPYRRQPGSDWAGDLGRQFIRLRDRKGADPNEWPADLRVQEFPP